MFWAHLSERLNKGWIHVARQISVRVHSALQLVGDDFCQHVSGGRVRHICRKVRIHVAHRIGVRVHSELQDACAIDLCCMSNRRQSVFSASTCRGCDDFDVRWRSS